MGVLIVLVLSVIISESSSLSYLETPRLMVEQKNLIFIAATDRYIKFITNSGKLLINNIDLLSTLDKAQNATSFLDNYQKTFSTYVDRLDSLEQRIPDAPVRLGNTSTSGVSFFTIRRLNRRINVITRKLAELQMNILLDDCVGNPCQNGGTCLDMYKNYACHCPEGWEGRNCAEDVNECTRFEGTDLGCQNSATCINKMGTYSCVCAPGFVGIHCNRRKADCSTAGHDLCGHGTCVQQNNAAGYKCICDQGWTTDGTNPACVLDVNECASKHPPCSTTPSVPCINVPGSFYCGSCPRGYTGNGYYCVDINECEINNGGCNTNPMVTCINTQGSRICGLCPPGYEGDGVSCTYRGSVCNVNNGGCHYVAQCRDNPRISSTYVECICPAGYVGSGIGPDGCIRSSSPFNPCISNPCVNGDCSVNNSTNDYVCSCRRRFTGRNCDILKDPCTPNPCTNGGTCQNLIGISFTCICKSGFSGIFCQIEAAGCGGKLTGTSGILKYPPGDYETYGHRLSCAWTIETTEPNVLNITFTQFDIESSTACKSDWLQIHDGKNSASRPLGRFCGTDPPLGGKIISTHNVIYLWFRSNAGNSKTGFKLTWNATTPVCGGLINVNSHGSIESPGSPGNYPSNRDCYWHLIGPFDKRFLFHFYALNIGNNADCSADYLEFSSDYHRDQPFSKFCNSSIPTPFYSLTESVEIHFHSDETNSYPGFQLTYSLVEKIPGCGGIYTEIEGIIQSLALHSSDLTNYICQYKIQPIHQLTTKITFLNFNIRDSVYCSSDFVEIREGAAENSSLIGRYCGNNLPPSYLSNNQIKIISSVDRTYSGWKVKYERVCGMKFSNNTGSFKSSGNINTIKSCIYQIEQPPGYVIELTLKINRVGVNCWEHYIEVRDGDHDNATLIKKLCESGTEIITSTHNHLWIRHYERSGLDIIDFEATYTSTNIGCGGILRKNMGNIASPTHPEGYYPSSLKCSWVIIAPPKSVIQLTWLTFNVELSHDCSYDNVKVFDNNTDLGQGELIGEYCGFTLPPISLSSGNIMTIVFATDVTINMDGFLATYIFLPEANVCGGNYYTSMGILKTPDYPNTYPFNRDCTWTITVPPGQQIMLNVTDFALEESVDCRYDWLEIRNGGTSTSPLIGNYCGTKIPKQIPSFANKLYIRFKTDLSRGDRGFKITWTSTATGCGGTLTSPMGSIISPQYPEPYSRNTDCTWKIVVSAGSKIQVMFTDLDVEQHMCFANAPPDYVQLFDGLAINSKSLGKFCVKEDKPILSSSHQMLVKFRSDIAYQGRGFHLLYTTICNNTLTGYRGVIESPNFPNNYPPNMDCWWHILVPEGNRINLTFSDFELESSRRVNKSCTFDYLEIKYWELRSEEMDYQDEDGVLKRQGQYCGRDNPGQISLNSDHGIIHFVSDKILMGSGFRLEWQLFGCGGILTRNSGIIQTPNYPNAYPKSTNCQWKIEVDFGYSIQIKFQEIDVERDDCNYDWVEIFNGPDNSSNVIAKICHQLKPITLSSTGNQMFIDFHSDYSYQGKGFSANYSAVPTKCGGQFTAPQGAIFSPNYPKNFDINDTCFWFIEVEDGHTIELSFKDVDLVNDCNKTYIKVYDGPTEAYPVLEKICGTAPEDIIKSSFNEMYIEFRATDKLHYTTKGFEANYKKSCGSRITQASGMIQITREEFPQLSNCTWTIVATDPTRHITLTITRMEMEEYYCEYIPAVRLYNGETTESPVINTFCGSKIPPPVVSDGSAMTIQLQEIMNFAATYTIFDSDCGGTFNSAKGFFASPGYPKKYPANMQCEWTITVAPGNHISLSFIEFDLFESDKCNTDYLEIRSNNVSGRLLGVYCGRNSPLNITHEGSLWMLYKGSKLDPGTTVVPKGFYGEYELMEYNELSGAKGVVASPMYPEKYHGYAMFSWKITVAPRKRILITFKEFYLEANSNDNNCYFATFEVYDGVDDTAPQILYTCGTTIPDPVKSSTNILYIIVHYSSYRMGTKFLFEWLEISNALQLPTAASSAETNCGKDNIIDVSTLTSNVYIVSSPGYPHGYKNNLNCEWIFTTNPMNHLAVYFLDLNLRYFQAYRFTSYCDGDYVTLYQKGLNDNDWQLMNKICTKQDHSGKNLHFSNILKMQFTTNGYLNGTGFRANVFQSCGGEMTGPTGYVTFNKTTMYGPSCQWNVTVRSGRTIRVTFEEMNIAHDPTKGCNNYIMLRNGKYSDSPMLGNGKYCGTELPEPLNTTGNNLYIKYNGVTSIKGFKLKYQELSVECGGEVMLSFTDNSTEISSPNYPNIPLPHTECSWIVRAPPGESLRIDFEERFDLTNRKECDIEYVELRDGGTQYSALIGRYCSEAPNTQFSTDSIIFVKFFTNAEDPRNGFKAKISLAYCGGTIRGSKGDITNPTSIKDERRNCTWYIVGPIDHYLNIEFTVFKLKKAATFGREKRNVITILEKNVVFNNASKLAEYTYGSNPTLVKTSSNEAIIHYVGSNEDKFKLEFNTSQSECGGILNSESGEVMSPGYPSMNHMNRDCKWTIEVPEGRRVTLDFLDFELDETSLYNQGVGIYDGSIPFKIRIAYLKPGSAVQSFETSSNKMTIFFWSHRPSFQRGFKAKYSSDKPTICSDDFSGDSGILRQPIVRNSSYWCQWTHRSKMGFANQTLALTVNLKSNSTRRISSPTCNFASWSITVTNSNDKNVLASLCSPNIENYIIRSPFPLNKIDAVAKGQMNFTIKYKTYKCGGLIYEQEGFLNSPNFPNKPSESLECAWLLKAEKEQTINVTVLNMDLGNDCDKNFLVIYNGDLPSHPRIGKYCKSDKPDVIISQSNNVLVEYRSDAGTTGTGFKLKYQAESEGCGGIYHDKSRIIQTPNYPDNYPNNAECLWEIRSNPGYIIQLQFPYRFHIEESDGCINDYIEPWDWQDGKWKSMGKKCGRTATEIQSTGDKLKLLFRTNNKTTASGFKAKWIWKCGGTFEATKTPRTLVSPGYPLVYTASLNCVYKITTKANVLNIVFDDFELEGGVSTDCAFDNVTISGKYFTTYAPLMRTFCGTTSPPPMRMRGEVIITFKTDKWVNKKGFQLTYSDESCGGVVNETTIIEAPTILTKRTDFRYTYPRIKCVWNITAPSKQIVVVRVINMVLPSLCYGQGVNIYKGLTDQRENRLATLCGNLTDSQPIHSDSGNMIIVLDSSPINYGGFKAQIYFSHGPTEGCGGTINLTETKYINSPDISDLDCIWRIIAPRDNQIEIHFTEINIPVLCSNNDTSTPFCGCSFIEVRDGGGSLSELIERLCSTSNTKTGVKYTTSWNIGFIRFVLTGRQSNAFRVTLTPVMSKCGHSVLNATKEIQTLTSPNYPDKYPQQIKCSWLITAQGLVDKIELHFVDFNLTYRAETFRGYNICDDDRVEIAEDPNRQIITEGFGPQAIYNSGSKVAFLSYNNVRAQHTFCGTEESPFDYYSSGKSLIVTFRSLTSLKRGKGFKLEYRLAGCNRNYTSLQGRIFSSNVKSECIITITVPENRTIALYFQKMLISFSNNCSKTSFEVRDEGPNGKLLMTTCGFRVPDPIFSFTNKLYIHVHLNQPGNFFQSYDVGYTSTDAGRGCGGDLYNYRGWVSSPLYPNEFRNSSVCIWTIRVPIGLRAALKFTKFDIQGECTHNHVEVTIYSSEGRTIEEVFCKDNEPGVLRSSSQIDIKYVSSIHNGGAGWLAVFQGMKDDTEVL